MLGTGLLRDISPALLTRQAQWENFPTSSPSTAVHVSVSVFMVVSFQSSVYRRPLRATPTLHGRGGSWSEEPGSFLSVV